MTPPRGIGQALNAEWRTIEDEPHPWQNDPLLPGGRFGALLGQPAPRADAALSRLLALQAAGDRRAGRVVLQAVLGLLVRLAASDPVHGLDEYVAECWLRIQRYPAHRTRCVAANLVLDTRKALRRADHREVAVPPHVFDLAAGQSQAVGSVVRLVAEARRLGLVDDLSGRCLLATYRDDLPSHEAGVRLGISATHVRWRTSRAVRTLAAHRDQLAAAA